VVMAVLNDYEGSPVVGDAAARSDRDAMCVELEYLLSPFSLWRDRACESVDVCLDPTSDVPDEAEEFASDSGGDLGRWLEPRGHRSEATAEP
jgi:hypothetical protein